MPSAPRMSPEEVSAMQQAARKRMLEAMGGDSEKLNSGAGVAFGFGAADDTDYGYGPPSAAQEAMERRAELFDDDIDLPTWLTADPVGAQDYNRRVDEGYINGESARGGGFDGRPMNWRRQPEMANPNPPAVENTLRSPALDALPAQAFTTDFRSAAADLRNADLQEAMEAEQLQQRRRLQDKKRLKRGLPKVSYDDEEEPVDEGNRPWNAWNRGDADGPTNRW